MRTSSKTHKCDEGGKQKRIGTGKDVEIMVTKAPAFVNRDFHDQDVRSDFKPPFLPNLNGELRSSMILIYFQSFCVDGTSPCWLWIK